MILPFPSREGRNPLERRSEKMEEIRSINTESGISYEPPEAIIMEVSEQAEMFNICDSHCA